MFGSGPNQIGGTSSNVLNPNRNCQTVQVWLVTEEEFALSVVGDPRLRDVTASMMTLR
jgi:hypothetical protein